MSEEIDNLRVKMGTHVAMRVYFEKSYEKEKVRGDNLEAMVDRMSAIVADCAMLVSPLRKLCLEIEMCGASEQLTKTVVLASEITNELKYIVGGVAVEERVRPTSEIMCDLQAASTIERPNKKNEFERLSPDTVLIDGKHYRLMNDKDTAHFIWGAKDG